MCPQCSRSCGSGSRNREVICSDREGKLYPARQCSSQPMPPVAERCNAQPCRRPQSEHGRVRLNPLPPPGVLVVEWPSLPALRAAVPSFQDPLGHNKTRSVFQPYAQETATGTADSAQPPRVGSVKWPERVKCSTLISLWTRPLLPPKPPHDVTLCNTLCPSAPLQTLIIRSRLTCFPGPLDAVGVINIFRRH